MNYPKIITVLLSCLVLQFNAQVKDSSKVLKTQELSFNPGDIIISANLGYPHVTPAIIRTSIKAYDKFITDQTLTFTVASHGVYNIKLEYALMDRLGLGVAGSYWDMSFNIQNDYSKEGVAYTDNLDVKMSAKALGVRGNYHFTDELESKVFDAYTGITIGATYYEKSLGISSTNPDRQLDEALPKKILNFNDGWATYFSSTAGIRIYPIKYIALNFELGWDRGAFLFGGVAVKIPTKPIKSFQD